jgi:hypothetical protein
MRDAMFRWSLLSLALSFVSLDSAQAEVNSFKELRPAIMACWRPPSSLERLDATVRFSLNRRGAIIGQPAITYSELSEDERTSRAFIASVLRALADCTPVDLSDAFAEALAGRPVTIRFVWDKRRKRQGV